ncbi:DinB family protein [Paenibacillus chitinolyticus]|uniref:DinB family protein n=1 Tax=Paenibacillus chitinolyticus TaxID=79263 RepID=UPI001C457EFB|nr:DinB family protein [Paenibacillus chitinolyticus]MBV6717396.1 DinB family protein [Paenibacillus chitinolyticus]
MSQASIQTAKTAHQLVIGSIQAIPEEIYDITPAGFNNTVRWNAGHIVTMLNWFLSAGPALNTKLPQSYAGLFMTGTKPSDWTVTPPSKSELIQFLSAQLDDLSNLDIESLNVPLSAPFEMGPLRFETAGELFNFAFIHEAVHLGIISSLVKAVQAVQADQ